MPTEAQKRASLKYQEREIVQISLKLNRKTDADVLNYLNSVDNIQGLIKDLIRDHMNKKASK